MITRRLGQFRCAVGSDNSKWVRRKPSSRVRHDAVLAEDDLRRAFGRAMVSQPECGATLREFIGGKIRLVKVDQDESMPNENIQGRADGGGSSQTIQLKLAA